MRGSNCTATIPPPAMTLKMPARGMKFIQVARNLTENICKRGLPGPRGITPLEGLDPRASRGGMAAEQFKPRIILHVFQRVKNGIILGVSAFLTSMFWSMGTYLKEGANRGFMTNIFPPKLPSSRNNFLERQSSGISELRDPGTLERDHPNGTT